MSLFVLREFQHPAAVVDVTVRAIRLGEMHKVPQLGVPASPVETFRFQLAPIQHPAVVSHHKRPGTVQLVKAGCSTPPSSQQQMTSTYPDVRYEFKYEGKSRGVDYVSVNDGRRNLEP